MKSPVGVEVLKRQLQQVEMKYRNALMAELQCLLAVFVEHDGKQSTGVQGATAVAASLERCLHEAHRQRHAHDVTSFTIANMQSHDTTTWNPLMPKYNLLSLSSGLDKLMSADAGRHCRV